MPIEAIAADALRLRGGRLRAVLDCPTLALGIKGEAEQRAVIDGWAALLVAFSARLKAGPELVPSATRYRVRHDKVDSSGRVTLRYRSQLRHIYIGRAHKGEAIRLLIAEPNVRIVREDGQLLRELTLYPDRRYFGVRTRVHNVVRQLSCATDGVL